MIVTLRQNNVAYSRNVDRVDVKFLDSDMMELCALLNCFPTAATVEEIQARIQVRRMYEYYPKTLENSSADAFGDNEIEALAVDVLRRNRVNSGQDAKHMLGFKLEGNDSELTDIPFELPAKKQ